MVDGTGAAQVTIRSIEGQGEIEACARLMAGSEPWITLGRTYEEAVAMFGDPAREIYVADLEGSVVGFLILRLKGAFSGYLQSVAVSSELRGRGIGSRLVRFAEERIFRDMPNVFLCVSSFNDRALALYERHGYEVIGELRDFIVSGHSEILLRKTTGPMRGFRPSSDVRAE
jgi:ribosomal protein S18 acetylase RimI-like enzyme